MSRFNVDMFKHVKADMQCGNKNILKNYQDVSLPRKGGSMRSLTCGIISGLQSQNAVSAHMQLSRYCLLALHAADQWSGRI